MRTIIKLDLLAQLLLVGVLFLVLVINPADAGIPMVALLFWQFISAVIITIKNNGHSPRRFLFLAGLFGHHMIAHWPVVTHIKWIIQTAEFLYVALPITLMICYFILTVCNLYPSGDHKGKFLPHTSF